MFGSVETQQMLCALGYKINVQRKYRYPVSVVEAIFSLDLI